MSTSLSVVRWMKHLKKQQFNADFEKYEAGIYMEFNNSEWKKLSIQDAYTLGSSFEDTFNAYFGK